MTTLQIIAERLFSHTIRIRWSDLRSWLCGVTLLDQIILRTIQLIAAPEDIVLEIGCGTGRLTQLNWNKFSPLFYIVSTDENMEAVETTAHRCRIVKSRLFGEQYQSDDGTLVVSAEETEHLSASDRTFGLIVCFMLSNRLTGTELRKMLRECFRTLKCGSKILVVDYGKPVNGLGWILWLLFGGKECRRGSLERFILEAEQQGFMSSSFEEVSLGWIYVTTLTKPAGGIPHLPFAPPSRNKA